MEARNNHLNTNEGTSMLSRMSDRSRQRLRTIITILATALVIAPATALATHSFDDVDDSDFYHAAVEWMEDSGVTVGCNPPDNTEYCPDDPVTRGEMAVFLERLDIKDVFLRPDEQDTDAETLDGKDSSEFGGRLFAVVKSDGTLVRGNGAESASKVGAGAGTYKVIFDRDVTDCAYIATIGSTTDDKETGGLISVGSRPFNTDGVTVETNDENNTLSDRSFHLIVIC